MRRIMVCVAALFLLNACGDRAATTGETDDAAANVAAEQPATAALAEKNAATQLDGIVKKLSREYFRVLPEIATYYGAPADLAGDASVRLTDRSPRAESERRAAMEAMLVELHGIDPQPLDPQRRTTHQTLLTMLDGALAPARIANYGTAFGEYGVWFLPYTINHNSGPTVATVNLMESQHRIESAGDAESYLARLVEYAKVLDGAREKMLHDADLGVVPPDFIVAKSQAVVAAFAEKPPAENVLYASFVAKLAQANLADADALGEKALHIVATQILPASQRVHAALETLKARATHDAGIWRLPDGVSLYRAMIRQMTDTDETPEQIHQTGLDEVARISAEMDAILREQGHTDGTVGERYAALAGDPRFSYVNTEAGKAQVLADIGVQMEKINRVLPRWFGALPKYGVEVRAVPAFSEDSAPSGYYDPPALDGSRPGTYWINLRDASLVSRISLPTLTYHESVPGHHLQVAITLGQQAPLISSAVFFSNASGEGWALYAEALAAEMGAYDDDPYGNLGRLQAELHRAVRLVVDTGMHAFRWSREKAVDYMVDTEGEHRASAISEIERYAVWPGQALGYKIGMLKLQALRREAEESLGERFDIRAYHDRLLRVSSTPLPVIESEIRRWIREQP